MSQQAKQLIAQAKAEKWTRLDLGNCGLTDLHTEVPELFELIHLEELVLSKKWWEWNEEEKAEGSKSYLIISQNKGEANKLYKLPKGIGRLNNLRVLICEVWRVNWGITDLSPLSGLANLTQLDLSANQIIDLSPPIGFGEVDPVIP